MDNTMYTDIKEFIISSEDQKKILASNISRRYSDISLEELWVEHFGVLSLLEFLVLLSPKETLRRKRHAREVVKHLQTEKINPICNCIKCTRDRAISLMKLKH